MGRHRRSLLRLTVSAFIQLISSPPAAPASVMQALTRFGDGLLELLSPERCLVCHGSRATRPWADGTAGAAPGLHWWHAPHLCAACHQGWGVRPVLGHVGEYRLVSALPETAELVRVVGAWKYHGLRGLARPLARLLVPVVDDLRCEQPALRLVPVPLHGRRRRERGFDQCLQLAVLVGGATGMPVVTNAVWRRRATCQQASAPTGGDQRAGNVAGAFDGRQPHPGEPNSLLLLDDLATTGATLAAAAGALTANDWNVAALVALGQAGRLSKRRG